MRTVFFERTDRWTRSFPRTGGVLRASRKASARRRASSTGAGATRTARPRRSRPRRQIAASAKLVSFSGLKRARRIDEHEARRLVVMQNL